MVPRLLRGGHACVVTDRAATLISPLVDVIQYPKTALLGAALCAARLP
jgi:hypothetical protein